MKKTITLGTATLFSLFLFSPSLYAGFGEKLCNSPLYTCHKVAKGESWKSMFPDEEKRMMVKKINRMNIEVRPGTTIAVPKNLDPNDFLAYSPLPQHIPAPGTELIKVELGKLAWGAYEPDGTLIKWGPISGGKASSKTVTGTYTFYRKQGSGCISGKYPLPRGGAPMPYCMHFRGGYAIHGSPTVPGYHASHGCVRLFTDDAQWLNQHFVDIGSTRIRIVP